MSVSGRSYRWLYLASLVCLGLVLVSGVCEGVIAAAPNLLEPGAVVRSMRPLHTLFGLSWLLLGLCSAIGARLRPAGWVGPLLAGLLLAFVISAAVTTVDGDFSGQVYVTWPALPSLLLLAALGLHLWAAWTGRAAMAAQSPEAAWLVLLGALLLPLGLLENLWFSSSGSSLRLGMALPVEWQSLDIIITGWSVSLYGLAILSVPGNGKPLRAPWLYCIAVLGILLDFGHHNYPSPQPRFLKALAFGMSLLAIVSFLRHVRALRRVSGPQPQASKLLPWIEAWTLFATAGGLLLAIPWLNRYVHGTYAIAGHAMGSMIGVNGFILLYAGVREWCDGDLSVGLAVRVAGWSLVVFMAVLTALGLAEGYMRQTMDVYAWRAELRPYFWSIPAVGLVLSLALAWIAGKIFLAAIRGTWMEGGRS